MTEQEEERLRKALRMLTPQQLRFVAVRPHCNNDAEAAREAGVAPATVWRWPQRVHQVVRWMAADGMIASYEIMRSSLPKAAMRKADGLDSADERIQQNAATEILDRFHGKPTQRMEANVTGAIAVKGYVNISPDDWDNAEQQFDSSVQAATVADRTVAGQESDSTVDR